MHKVLDDGRRVLLSLSVEELSVLARASAEVRDSSQFSSDEFFARFGVAREGFSKIIAGLLDDVHESRNVSELVQAWEDQGSVMVRVLNSWGDPVELGEAQASEFSEQLQRSIRDAS